jgi:hypothetical protein
MKVFQKIFFFFFLFNSVTFFAQDVVKTTLPDTISHWEKKNTVGLDITQIAFVNWNAGGNSSISGLLKGNFLRKYQKGNLKWVNEMIIRYGVNKQDGVELRKTDDVFQVNSTLGYRKDTISNWYSSAKFNFNTQFTNGYAYPNTTKAISKPFAPAYIFLGVGSEYVNKPKKLNVYISPITMKTTLVLDQTLANQGAFGVNKAVFDKLSKADQQIFLDAAKEGAKANRARVDRDDAGGVAELRKRGMTVIENVSATPEQFTAVGVIK